MARGIFGIGWLDFSSKKEKDRYKSAYKKLLFPFGDQQEKWEEKIYNEVFSEFKNCDVSSLRYIGLLLRQKYCVSKLDEDSIEREMFEDETDIPKMVKNLRISDEQFSLVKTIVDCENKANLYEDLPDSNTIKQIVKQNH